MGGIEDCAVGGADELMSTDVEIDGHAFMCTSLFAGHEITIGKMDEDTAVSIGWICEVLATGAWYAGRADYRSWMRRMRWRRVRRGGWVVGALEEVFGGGGGAVG